MLKRIFVFTLVLALALSCSLIAQAENSPPATLEKPQSPALWQSHESTLEFRWENPASILQIVEDINESAYSASFYYLVDWKKNDGSWNIAITTSDPSWDYGPPWTIYGIYAQFDG